MRSPFAIPCSRTVAASVFPIILLAPIFTNMPLPGGAASSWIAAFVFYQIALLAGAFYAHVTNYLPLRAQGLLHPAAAAAGLLALPPGWNFLYGAAVATIVLVGWKAQGGCGETPAAAPATRKTPLTAALALRWILLAAVPSALLPPLTHFMSDDAGSPPLLGAAPLALYLASFILAFSGESDVFGRLTRSFHPIPIIAGCIGLALPFTKVAPVSAPILALAPMVFGFAALGCHCELARLKPDPSRLTFFLFAVALGGAMGGLFNALVDNFAALPIGLILAGLLIGRDRETDKRSTLRPYALAALATIMVGVALSLPNSIGVTDDGIAELRGPLPEK